MDFQLSDALQRAWTKLGGWAEGMVAMLPNLVVALVILLLFALLARLGHALVSRSLGRLGRSDAAAALVSRFAQIAILAAGLLVALSVLQLERAVTSLLAGAGILGLALGFAFQDLGANFISGVALAMRARYPFEVGDLIETNGVLGVAEEIHLRTTVIRTLDGQAVVIPNKKIFEEKLTNLSGDPYRRVDVPCGVSYGEDLREVKRVVSEAVEAMDGRLPERGVEFFWTGYGGSSIDFVVRFWIPFEKQVDYLEAISETIMRIKQAFDERDITIPFPIRTLDFGIKGGEGLRQVLDGRQAEAAT
jgi:small conductance mechanosensitive channel